MPAGFDKCVAGGGRVRRKNIGKNRYINLCFKDGKSYAGETHTKKAKKV